MGVCLHVHQWQCVATKCIHRKLWIDNYKTINPTYQHENCMCIPEAFLSTETGSMIVKVASYKLLISLKIHFSTSNDSYYLCLS